MAARQRRRVAFVLLSLIFSLVGIRQGARFSRWAPPTVHASAEKRRRRQRRRRRRWLTEHWSDWTWMICWIQMNPETSGCTILVQSPQFFIYSLFPSSGCREKNDVIHGRRFNRRQESKSCVFLRPRWIINFFVSISSLVFYAQTHICTHTHTHKRTHTNAHTHKRTLNICSQSSDGEKLPSGNVHDGESLPLLAPLKWCLTN